MVLRTGGFIILLFSLLCIYGCSDNSTNPSGNEIKITRITSTGHIFLSLVTHSRTSVMYVLAGDHGEPFEIRSCSVNGKNDKLILSFPAPVRKLIVSADDTKIAFTTTASDTAVIYYYNIITKELLEINRGFFLEGPVFNPCYFSHNDTKIIGTVIRDGSAVIACLSIPGGEIHELTTGSHAYPLAYNHTGNEIYYQQNGELRVYSDAGEKTAAEGYFYSAVVTGDGKFVYASLAASDPDKHYVSKMNADGSNFSIVHTTDYCMGRYIINDFSRAGETLLITRQEGVSVLSNDVERQLLSAHEYYSAGIGFTFIPESIVVEIYDGTTTDLYLVEY